MIFNEFNISRDEDLMVYGFKTYVAIIMVGVS